MGWPADLTWYKLLTEWGSVIGGGFALIAGAALYVIGRTQAKATMTAANIQAAAMRKAAEQQVATANAELEHLKAEKAEDDQRAREDLLAALDTEAARIVMLAELKSDAVRRRHTTVSNSTVMQAALYKMPVGRLLSEGRGIPTLVHGKIRLAVRRNPVLSRAGGTARPIASLFS